MGRVLRSNARWVSVLFGVPDAYAVETTNAIAGATGTASPAARGVQRFMGGLPGADVNQCHSLTGPQQQFAGVDVRLINLAGADRPFGTLNAGSLPGNIAAGGSTAWLDLGRLASTGYGG
jgi:hypothetical protein